MGARERWEPDRILGLVKENSTLPAVQGVARSARKVKAWLETVVTKDLVWDRWARGHSGLAVMSPLLLSLVPGVWESLAVSQPLLQPLLSRPRADPPSLPGASHGERRRRGGGKTRGEGVAEGDYSERSALPPPLALSVKASSSLAGYKSVLRRQGVINNQLGGSLRLL